jgi:hypothetical protein
MLEKLMTRKPAYSYPPASLHDPLVEVLPNVYIVHGSFEMNALLASPPHGGSLARNRTWAVAGGCAGAPFNRWFAANAA